MIEAVFFDIDGTLLDHDAASGGSLRLRLEAERGELDEAAHAEAGAEWRRLEHLHYGSYLGGEIDLHEQRRRRAGGMLEWLGVPEREEAELDAWFADFLEGYRAQWVLFDDVLPVIGELERAGVALGVITNADATLQRRKLAALELDERLPLFVASSDAPHPKPHPSIFRTAAEAAGLPPERVAYVGDRLNTDARGARDAGLLGVWVDRGGSGTEDEPAGAEDPGVPRIESLQELLRGVLELEPGRGGD